MSPKSSGKLAVATLPDEAESHVRDVSAHGIVAEWLRWLRVPPVSGLECVRALQADGFSVVARLPGCVTMKRGELEVEVPLAERLAPEVLIAMLIRARVGPARFLDLLEGVEPALS